MREPHPPHRDGLPHDGVARSDHVGVRRHGVPLAARLLLALELGRPHAGPPLALRGGRHAAWFAVEQGKRPRFGLGPDDDASARDQVRFGRGGALTCTRMTVTAMLKLRTSSLRMPLKLRATRRSIWSFSTPSGMAVPLQRLTSSNMVLRGYGRAAMGLTPVQTSATGSSGDVNPQTKLRDLALPSLAAQQTHLWKGTLPCTSGMSRSNTKRSTSLPSAPGPRPSGGGILAKWRQRGSRM